MEKQRNLLALTPEQVVDVLVKSGYRDMTLELLHSDFDAGAPLKKDGTIEGGGKWKIGYWNSDMEMGDGVTKDGKGFEQIFLENGVSMLVELNGGVKVDGVCAYGWDQDRKCQTVFFTGLADKGIAVWGQRIPPAPNKAD